MAAGPMLADAPKKSAAIIKHSLTIAGHRTSISLEHAFWEGLRAIARRQGEPVAALVARIDADRGGANLSSAIRVYVFAVARADTSEAAPDEISPRGEVAEASRKSP